LCSPKCDAQGKCPMDVPAGTWHKNTTVPQCILSDASTGEHYCALTCVLVGCPTGAHCAMIGIVAGVCLYPNGTQTDALPVKSFVMNSEKKTHPTLPTSWTALVNEDEVGIVHESEHMVSGGKGVSAKWTNYTDGSCQRLILDDKRYLLGCDAVNCCTEDGESPLEYQIPNVHPQFLAPVKFNGTETLTLFDKSTVDADHWQWKFAIMQYDAWTTTAADGTGVLHKWSASTSGQHFPNEYVNYKAVPASEEDAFLATFQVPDVCKASYVRPCGSLHKEGKLSDKSLAFVRGGNERLSKPTQVMV